MMAERVGSPWSDVGRELHEAERLISSSCTPTALAACARALDSAGARIAYLAEAGDENVSSEIIETLKRLRLLLQWPLAFYRDLHDMAELQERGYRPARFLD